MEAPALTRVCREMCEDTIDLFYTVNDFSFPIFLLRDLLVPDCAQNLPPGTEAVRKWLRRQSFEGLRAIGTVKLDIGTAKFFSSPPSYDYMMAELVKNIRELRDEFKFLEPLRVSVSLCLTVLYVPLHPRKCGVEICLPLYDRDGLRATGEGLRKRGEDADRAAVSRPSAMLDVAQGVSDADRLEARERCGSTVQALVKELLQGL